MNQLPDLLPEQVVDEIKTFISNNINIKERPLKEGVFNVLREYAVLVFYPLEEQEENDAFLLKNMPWTGEKKHFVFINSSKTKEKQVFAAAHELGHILNLIDNVSVDRKNEELVVNRMAAYLLMPEDLFYIHIRKNGIKIKLTKEKFLEIVVATMNDFSCTFEAVVLRFYELGLLGNDYTQAFIARKAIENQDEYIRRIMVEKKYEELLVVTKEKSIDGLENLIDLLSKKNKLTPKALRLKNKYAAMVGENKLLDNLIIHIE